MLVRLLSLYLVLHRCAASRPLNFVPRNGMFPFPYGEIWTRRCQSRLVPKKCQVIACPKRNDLEALIVRSIRYIIYFAKLQFKFNFINNYVCAKLIVFVI